jgi:molecular chaperone GrpE
MSQESQKNRDHQQEDNTIPVNVVRTELEKEEREEKGLQTDEEAKTVEYLDHLQRLKAEFDNYRKRVEKERETLYTQAKTDMIRNLLSVMDDLERMLNHHRDDSPCPTEGIRLIYQNFRKVLTSEGLEEIKAINEDFNPELHEAVSVEETSLDLDGKVLEEWQKGYCVAGKLVRPSKVKVGKFIEKAGESGDRAEGLL